MKILLELPTWLGDAVMATSAIDSLLRYHPDAEVTLFGSFVATETLKAHPQVTGTVVDRTREGFRPWNIYRTAKALGPYDLALSFRSHFSSTILLHLSQSKKIYQYRKKTIDHRPSTIDHFHQVERYQHFINAITGRRESPGPLRLDWTPQIYKKPTLGINPGATYGSAKRWYPERFAEVAAAFAPEYEILIFGGPGETDIASDIEKDLKKRGIRHLRNLAGKTTIPELCSAIGELDLFLTNDSGPMHIAAAYQVPTVAIFGPTKWRETSQWKNPRGILIRREMECSPCMKRSCPLKHHACMKEITAAEVIEAAQKLLSYKGKDSQNLS